MLTLLATCRGFTRSVAGMRRAGWHRPSLAIELFNVFPWNTTILPKTSPELEVRVTAALLNRLSFKNGRKGRKLEVIMILILNPGF